MERILRSCGTGVMVNVVYCCSSEETTFELRGADGFFLLIVITDFVTQVSGDI